MTIPTETKELLLQLRDRLPAERRDAFAASVSTHLRELAGTNTVYYTLMGGLTGYLLSHLPLVGILTHDHGTEIGMALGAWVGLARDHEERKHRETTQSIIQEAIRHALA